MVQQKVFIKNEKQKIPLVLLFNFREEAFVKNFDDKLQRCILVEAAYFFDFSERFDLDLGTKD